jgi:hypothetical protein
MTMVVDRYLNRLRLQLDTVDVRPIRLLRNCFPTLLGPRIKFPYRITTCTRYSWSFTSVEQMGLMGLRC